MDEKVRYHSGLKAYSIKLVSNLHSSDGKPLYGEVNYTDEVISLESEMSEKMQRIALCHEIIHDWLEQGGREQDENLACFLGYRLAEFLLRLENKDLHTWLQESL